MLGFVSEENYPTAFRRPHSRRCSGSLVVLDMFRLLVGFVLDHTA
jgi:hypothetical protein